MNIPKTSVVFFGTHTFAATILEGLIKNPAISIDLVITQPDRPVGRKKELQSPPVKIISEKYKINFIQPETLKNFRGLFPIPYSLFPKFQLAIVAQYGLLIPEDIINAPKFGTLNIHTSLLPKYRGASPIQSALINGETETGITIMKMDKGLDTGPILLQKKLKIDKKDTYQILDVKLANIGLSAISETIPLYLSGKLKPIPQNNTQATICRQLTRNDGKIDWTKNTQDIYNLYRGLYPWPGIWTMWQEKRLKLLKIKPAEKKYQAGAMIIENEKIFIGCGDKSIEILELQLEGKKNMDIKAFINGNRNIHNSKLN